MRKRHSDSSFSQTTKTADLWAQKRARKPGVKRSEEPRPEPLQKAVENGSQDGSQKAAEKPVRKPSNWTPSRSSNALIKTAVPDTKKAGQDDESFVPLSVAALEQKAQEWFFENEFQGHSRHTVDGRRSFVRNLTWFLKKHEHTTFGPREIKEFFIYLTQHCPDGRWGHKRFTQPLRSISIKDYFVNLRIMFRWLEAEGLIQESPMEKLPMPKVRQSQIQPMSPGQVSALLKAARESYLGKRDLALVTLLVDVGLRASEAGNLQVKDVDLQARCVRVMKGKGGKSRTVFMGKNATKAMWVHLRAQKREPDDYIFVADRGNRPKEKLTPSGVYQVIHRLGKAAGITGVRVSPHTLRHTHSVLFLRAGGNVFTLRQNLGHTGLEQTSRYVMVAQADQEEQSKQFSPMDRLKGL